MIKSKKISTDKPNLGSSLEAVEGLINEFVKSIPMCKIINIEHVVSQSTTTYGNDSYFICVWYDDSQS